MKERITVEELAGMDQSLIAVCDLRDPVSFGLGSVKGAENYPPERLGELFDIPADKKIVVFCQSGQNSGEIVRLLRDSGRDAADIAGGYREYVRFIMKRDD